MPPAVLPSPDVLQAAAQTLERELPADLQRARGAYIVPSLSPGSRVDEAGGTGDLAPGRLLETAAHPDTDEAQQIPYTPATGPERWSDEVTDRDSRFPRALLVKHSIAKEADAVVTASAEPEEPTLAATRPVASKTPSTEPAKPVIRKHYAPIIPTERAGVRAIDTLRPKGRTIRWAHVVEEKAPTPQTQATDATIVSAERELDPAEVATPITPTPEKGPVKTGRLRYLGKKVVALAAVAGSVVGLAGEKHEPTSPAGKAVGAVISTPSTPASPEDVVSVDDMSGAERVGASVVAPTDSTHASHSEGWHVGARVELPADSSAQPHNQNREPSTPPSASIPSQS